MTERSPGSEVLILPSRPFQLIVDSGSRDEPSPRSFGSLDAALNAMSKLDSRWLPFVWITEKRPGAFVVHIRDGRRGDSNIPGPASVGSAGQRLLPADGGRE